MRRSWILSLALTIIVFGMSAAVNAKCQQNGHHQTIKSRQKHQQNRIAKGIKKGNLTAGESSRLEKREARTDRLERKYKHSGNGLSRSERRKLNRRLDKSSKA